MRVCERASKTFFYFYFLGAQRVSFHFCAACSFAPAPAGPQGGTGTRTITVTNVDGLPGDISLCTGKLMNGFAVTFSPSTVSFTGPGSRTVTVTFYYGTLAARASDYMSVVAQRRGVERYTSFRYTVDAGTPAAPSVSTPFCQFAAFLRFTTQPGSGTNSATAAQPNVALPRSPVVVVFDDLGVPFRNANPDVQLAIKAGTGAAGATVTFESSFDRGTVTFSNVKIDRAGKGYVLVASQAGLASVGRLGFTAALLGCFV